MLDKMIELLQQGLTDKEIARRLGCSESRVEAWTRSWRHQTGFRRPTGGTGVRSSVYATVGHRHMGKWLQSVASVGVE